MASEAKKLKTNATQCQTGKCANLSKVNKVELKTLKIKSTKVKTTEVKREQSDSMGSAVYMIWSSMFLGMSESLI
jgi:hypothetical protein